ncbi:hypothetical protein EP232_06260 [bacterium]|nr:MAG: hypothetical protein EP232_06260 [bacterium]
MRGTRALAAVLLLAAFSGCCSASRPEPTTKPSSAVSPVVFELPETVILVLKPDVVFIPDLPIDIFYYEKRWYWLNRGEWYWSRSYLGMLYPLSEKEIPGRLLKFSSVYQTELSEFQEIPFEQWWQEETSSQ